MDIALESELDKLTKDLDDIQKKQIPFATSVSLNETAKDVHAAEIKEMKKVFNKPTGFILKSLRVVRSSKKSLEAKVGFKDVFGSFGSAVEDTLKPHIEGGSRKLKGSERTLRRKGILRNDEYIVPSRALRLNKFGNITPGTMNKILSNIGSQSDSAANTPAAKRTLKYVVGEVGGTRGIWTITAKRWRPVIIFVKRPSYQKRFDFYRVADKTHKKNLPKHMSRNLEKALATAK